MKVTYIYNKPLDGAGTIFNPAYKWMDVERTEFCHHIVKAGNLYYMMTSQGYVIHSIDVSRIKTIEFADMVVCVNYHDGAPYPFTATFDRLDGSHYMNQGSTDFTSILESIRQYNHFYLHSL